MKINGFAKGNGKVVHALVDGITLCTLNTKKKKKMTNESQSKVSCKKCMRMELFKDFVLSNKKVPGNPKPDKPTTSKLKDKQKALKKKEELVNNNINTTEEDTKTLIVWAITTSNSYKIVTSTSKHKPTPTNGEKLELVAKLKDIDDFNNATENGKLIGKITLNRLKERLSKYDKNVTFEKEKEPIKTNTDTTEKDKTTEKDEEENKSDIVKEPETKSKKYDTFIRDIATNYQNGKCDFICKIKTDFNYIITHKPSRQKFFDGIPQDIILQSLAILNNMDSKWDGKHCMPQDFIMQCKLAMAAAFESIGKKYPVSLEEIAKEHKYIPCKKNNFVIKRRKKKIIKIKHRKFKLKRRKERRSETIILKRR